MNLLRKFATTACAAAFALAVAGLSRADPTDDDRFVGAMQLYHDCHYSAAYGRLAQLADNGHTEAARIALLMVRLGLQLYRNDWWATPNQSATGSRQPASCMWLAPRWCSARRPS